MPREYYDRGLPTEKLQPANSQQQNAYWYLRSRLTAALARSWSEIEDVAPDVLDASNQLYDFVENQHPRTAFDIFKPEDATAKHEASGRGRRSVYLR